MTAVVRPPTLTVTVTVHRFCDFLMRSVLYCIFIVLSALRSYVDYVFEYCIVRELTDTNPCIQRAACMCI